MTSYNYKNINLRKWTIGIVFIIICIIATGYILKNPETKYTRDSFEYLKISENLKNYGIFYAGDLNSEINPALYSRRPPGYPIFISLSKFIFNKNITIIFMQILLVALNVFVLFRLLSLLKIKDPFRLISILLFILFPTQIIYTQTIMSEIFLQTTLLAGLYFITRYHLSEKVRYLLLFNSAFALGLLIKPILMYFWIPLFIIHIWIFKRNRQLMTLFLPLILIFTMGAWSLRNYSQTGYLHYSSIRPFNLLYYNTHSFLVSKYGVEDADYTISEIDSISTSLDFRDANEYVERECIKILTNNWFYYGMYHFRGMFFFFIDPGRFDLYNFLGIATQRGFFHQISQSGIQGFILTIRNIPATILLILIIIFLINLILLLSLILSLKRSSIPHFILTHILLTIGYFAVLTGPLGASRFKLPIFPYLIVILACTLQNWVYPLLMKQKK